MMIIEKSIVAHLLLVCLFCLFTTCYSSQYEDVWISPELANYTINLFNESVDFRQNFCHRYAEVANGTRELKDALDGMELRPILLTGSPHAVFDPEATNNEEYRDEYLVLKGDLLFRLCEKANCKWKNSFASMSFVPEKNSNKTYNDLLKWSSHSFDLSVSYWLPSSKRIGERVSFMEPWFNGDIIMVKKTDKPMNSWISFSFLDPFSFDVWLSVIATCILSGLVYWILNILSSKDGDKNIRKDPTLAIHEALMAITSQFDDKQATFSARLFTFSLSFWALLISNSYVANLTNFLVKKNLPHVYETVDDVFRRGERVCTLNSSQAENEIIDRFGKTDSYLIRSKYSYEELYAGVRSGECLVAITLTDNWKLHSNMTKYNPNCELAVTGRVFRQNKGGFALVSDLNEKCTTLIENVLNYWMLEIKESGEFKDVWRSYLEKRSGTVKENGCFVNKDAPDPTKDLTIELTMDNLGGIFFIHAVMVILSLFLALGLKYFKVRRKGGANRCIKDISERSDLDEDTSFMMSDNDTLNQMKYDIKNLDEKMDAKLSKLINILVEQDSQQFAA